MISSPDSLHTNLSLDRPPGTQSLRVIGIPLMGGGCGCNSTIKNMPPTMIRYPVKEQWDAHTPETKKHTHIHTQNTHVPTRYLAFGHERSAHLFRNFEGFLLWSLFLVFYTIYLSCWDFCLWLCWLCFSLTFVMIFGFMVHKHVSFPLDGMVGEPVPCLAIGLDGLSLFLGTTHWGLSYQGKFLHMCILLHC